MTSLRDQLVDFHARYSCDELKHVAAYAQLCAEHEGEEPFETDRSRMASINTLLEGGLRSADGTAGQLIAAIETAKHYIFRAAWRDGVRDLALRRWEDAWSDAQKQYLEVVLTRLSEGDDVFLSFTNYNPAAPDGVNAVNTRYQELITTAGGLRVKRPESVERNLVAKMMRAKLKENHLQVFYWEEELDPAAVVTSRLHEKVDGAFVFVQLIQSQLFERDPRETPNFCLLEYETANTEPLRVIPLFIEPVDQLIKPQQLAYDDYDAWWEGLMGRTWLELETAATLAQARAEIDRIVAILNTERNKAHDRLIAGVPG
jgi:hypothetical protein